jgi:hypothetical protein
MIGFPVGLNPIMISKPTFHEFHVYFSVTLVFRILKDLVIQKPPPGLEI